MVGFGISGVEPSGSATRELVIILVHFFRRELAKHKLGFEFYLRDSKTADSDW
jgi:hypothetical protein